MAATVLQLSIGTDELDLNDGVTWALMSGWIPQVARRRRSVLGGRSPYEDVGEMIPLAVLAGSAESALTAIQELSKYLDHAARWAAGGEDDPVVLSYLPANSSLSSALQALVVDVPAPMMELPTGMHRELETGEFGPIYVHLLRRGLWLGASSSESVTKANNPAILTKDTGAALDVPGPTYVELTDVDGSTALIEDGYILFTDVAPVSTYGRNFQIYDASDMTSSEFGEEVDTTHKAIGDNVERIDAASNQTGSLTISNVLAEVKRLSVFVAVRNNNASAWKIRVRSTGFSEVTGRWYWIDTSSTQPRIMYIGTLISSWPSYAHLVIDVETAESTGTLDINYAVVFPHGQNSQIIGILGDDYNDEAYARVLKINHGSLTDEGPLLYVETDTS